MMAHPFSRMWAVVAGRLARAARPHFLPLYVAPEGAALAKELRSEYEQAVVQGYLSARKIILEGPTAAGKKGLQKDVICKNLRQVGERFAEAARTLDPDGLASELVQLFCVGVPHMDVLDNQRRVVAVWSALLAPAVVQRHSAGTAINQEDILEMACHWLETGTTKEASQCADQSETRFVAAHPARIYELMADTAASHSIDLGKLLASVVHPVVLSVGGHVGAALAAGGRVVPELDAMLKRAGKK